MWNLQIRDVPRLERAPVGAGVTTWAGMSSDSAGLFDPRAATPVAAASAGYAGLRNAARSEWQPEMQVRCSLVHTCDLPQALQCDAS